MINHEAALVTELYSLRQKSKKRKKKKKSFVTHKNSTQPRESNQSVPICDLSPDKNKLELSKSQKRLLIMLDYGRESRMVKGLRTVTFR
ncbi:hypothetical protein E2986_10870 [Frieseomelitta varia]|uniref:Uncharacterized protein n=1 Tax=Frieseomelitta varia TaxID=561572 RepID=A0A833SEI5_9HYME|nr:hypothetical protein E2986_10870 [Frieseomelitta varia]